MRKKQGNTLPGFVNPQWRVGIVHSTYYEEEVGAMVSEVKRVLIEAGVREKGIVVYPAPGSFEIPLLGAALAERGRVDALIGLGIIVEGETHHARLLAEQVARGIMDVQVRYRIPFAFEVLYVKNLRQALVRSRGKTSKGAEAARAALHSLAELKRICS